MVFGGEKIPTFITPGKHEQEELKKMENKIECDECGGTDFEEDRARGEMTCEACGLAVNNYTNDADTNSSISMGEHRTQESLDAFANNPNAAQGGRMNPFGDRTDHAGNRLTPSQRRVFIRLGRADRSSQREKDPMCREVKMTLARMFGDNLARATTHLADAACRKLSPEREAIRRTLRSGEKAILSCPKTSITRKPKGIRGDTHQDNLQIMALAIAILSHEWLNTPAFNPQVVMAQYGISEAQFKNAKTTISKSYKARCSQGWATAPKIITRGALRADKLDIAAENLDAVLSQQFAEEDLELVNAMFWDIMTDLEEPTAEGPLANVAVGYVAGCVMYATLCLAGLNHGNLGRVAGAVGLSPAGLTNRLSDIEKRVFTGKLPEGSRMFSQVDQRNLEPSSDKSQVDEGAEE